MLEYLERREKRSLSHWSTHATLALGFIKRSGFTGRILQTTINRLFERATQWTRLTVIPLFGHVLRRCSFAFTSPLATLPLQGTWHPQITSPCRRDVWAVGSTEAVALHTTWSQMNATSNVFSITLTGMAMRTRTGFVVHTLSLPRSAIRGLRSERFRQYLPRVCDYRLQLDNPRPQFRGNFTGAASLRTAASVTMGIPGGRTVV